MAVPVSAAVKISPRDVTLIKGQSKTLKIPSANGKVKWSSSKKSIATVTAGGKVTAKKRVLPRSWHRPAGRNTPAR